MGKLNLSDVDGVLPMGKLNLSYKLKVYFIWKL